VKPGVGLLGGVALVASLASPSAAAIATAKRLASQVPSNTVWLCRPGEANDPCRGNLATTSVNSMGVTTPVANAPATSSKYDCFYVCPTVSTQPAPNANPRVQPAEIGAATARAAQFSQVCNVWAPMYRQRTNLALQVSDVRL
jgi:hypothetical protein